MQTSITTMGGRTVDSLQCFTHLADDVPSWIAKISDLVAHTTSKRAEFSAEYSKLTNMESKPRRRKTSSVHSIRPDDMDPSIKGNADGGSNKTIPDDRHVDPVVLLKLSKSFPQEVAQRKRRIDGATSRSANNCDRVVRPRYPLIVHYDSETQNILEQLVRDIGGARNNIRKAKMNQMMRNNFGMNLPTNLLGGSESRHILQSLRADPTPSLKSERDAAPPVGNVPPFDLADKHLEFAQSLCESAAHQFLRNGDCSTELEKTKERFSSLLEVARAEVERLEAEAERQKHEAEKREEKLESKAVKEEHDRHPAAVSNAIEVDDDSSRSSISFDITAFRSTRFRA